MRSALIGHTGFVGSNLRRCSTFDAQFNSRNIEEIEGQSFDLLVCCGMPAAKWIVNKDPESDLANMNRLLGCLKRTHAKRLVLISTIDVYPVPINVDESTLIDCQSQHAYGGHRLMLERALAEHFDSMLIIRLPGLFGPGLKKNALYDLLHNNQIEKLHCNAVFQWYNLEYLWNDVKTALHHNLAVVNFATEPISVGEMSTIAFNAKFENCPAGAPAKYDFRSRHFACFGGRGGYLYDRGQVLADLKVFVQRERQLQREACNI